MQFKHALARAVTASALAAIVTVGAVGPVHADQGKGTDRSAAAKSAAADRKAEANAEKDANKGQRRNAHGPAKAQDGKQSGKSEGKPAKPAKGKPAKAQSGKQSGKPDTRASKQNPRGHGHTPVTVCHLRGNGTYIEITFDENALDAHKNHGDLYPVPAGGCPATADEGADVDEESGVDEGAGVEAEAAPVQDEILGVQAEADATTEAGAAAAADAAAAAGATGAPANASAGILPNTGAGQFGLALLAGLGLLAAGAAFLARRRPQMSR